MPRTSARWPWLALALAVAVTGAWILRARTGRGGLEPLDEARLERARARWEAAGPPSYRMTVEVTGVSDARHEVVVRDGTVVALTTDGVPAPERVRPAWSVEGLFGILADDVRLAQRREASGSPPLLLLAAFDDRYGYPAALLRHEQGGTRAQQWAIVSFTPGPGPP